MCEVIDIVLQGPANAYTLRTAEEYLTLPFVHHVIISCWLENHVETSNPRINIIQHEDLENPGPQNCNRQIKTSLEGLNHVSTTFSMKCRCDVRVHLDSMMEMYHFYNKHKEGNPYKIGVLAFYTDFPFHPHDQILYGHTKDLIDFFTIPYSDMTGEINFNEMMRAEAYLAVHYFARFDDKINEFIKDKKKYLVDNAPHVEEAIELSNQMMDKLFLVFPKINHEWPKYSPELYSYEFRKKVFKGFYWHTSDK